MSLAVASSVIETVVGCWLTKYHEQRKYSIGDKKKNVKTWVIRDVSINSDV